MTTKLISPTTTRLAIVAATIAVISAAISSNASARPSADERAQALFVAGQEYIAQACGNNRDCQRINWLSFLDYIDRTAGRQTDDPRYRDAIANRLQSLINAQIVRVGN